MSHTDRESFWEKRRQQLFIIRELTAREIKRRYARSYLGIIWSVLNPLLNMIVMSLIFSYMFSKNIDNFPVYYLVGTTLWTLFKTATETSMTALVDNKQLLIKAKLPKYTFVISRIYTSLVNFLYTLIPLIAILIFFKVRITWKAVLFLPDLLLVLLFSIGMGLIMSIIYVYFADVKYLYEIFLTIWMYLSAIFYPAECLPEMMQQVISYNPLFLAIDIARYTMIYNTLPYYTEWIKLGAFSLVVFGLGILIFRKYENKIMEKV